ncbi:MAG: MFS transporter [Bryobacteraceae bacterium]|nr:MFS transporter [Bryobacteraceae bacterium]
MTLLLFSLGHFLVDLYSGSMGIFQPLLINRLGITLTQAGILGGVLAFSSSITQPLYGYLSDRFRSRMFSTIAPAVAGVFIAMLGAAPTYRSALIFAFVGGAGVASFHPQASVWAAAGMRANRARWMSVFITAGTLGIALSPVFFSTYVVLFGHERMLWTALPGVLLSLTLLAHVRPPQAVAHRRQSFDGKALKAVWRPLTILYCGVFFRSAVQVTYAQFLALYLNRERGYSLSAAALALTLYLTAGAVGGFAGGYMADRYGARRVILLSFALSIPFMLVFFLSTGWWSILSLALGGLILLFTIPVNVVVAQELAPSQAGTVSALLMGFAWGAAGIVFIPLTGFVAQRSSLHVALFSLLVFPVLGWILAHWLPHDLGRRKEVTRP